MPTRIYAPNSGDPSNSSWQSPTNISIYDDSYPNPWRSVKVAYVYNLGLWNVVYPDPIIPSISILGTFSGKYYDTNELYIGATVSVLNGNNDIITAELFSGSTATGTPISSLTFNATSVSGDTAVYEPEFYSVSFANGTYCIRITATSVTNNSLTITTSPIILAIPTVQITSSPPTQTTSFSVTWSSTNQYKWRVSIIDASTGGTDFSSNNGNWTVSNATTFSSFISPALLGNTQYYILVEIENNDFDSAEARQYFTTPDFPTPIVQITSVNSTSCSSIYLEWTAQNTTYGNAKIYDVVFGTRGEVTYTEITSKAITWTTGRNHTFTGLSPSTNYLVEIIGYNELNVAGPKSTQLLSTVSASAPNPPANFVATSTYYGNDAILSWSQPALNCSTLIEYALQYRQSSSSTWINLTSSTTGTSYLVSWSGVTLIANTQYDFRIFARSSMGNSGYAYSTITTSNNPYRINLFSAPTGTTFSSIAMTAYLTNISGATVPQAGTNINFSVAESGRGSFSSTSQITNFSGWSSVTFNTNQTTGPLNFTASSSGLINGTDFTLVSLSNALNPSLSSTRTNFGYIITHSNYNSSWAYNGSVNNGGFNFDGVWNDGSYDIVIPPINTAFPVASRNALVSVTCTSGTWTAQPSATTTVTNTRAGYEPGSASITNSPTGTLSFSYTWYFGTGAFAGNGQTLSITSAMRGRNMYCIVVATRTGGFQGFQAQSNTIQIPA